MTHPSAARSDPRASAALLLLAYVAFVSIGLPDTVLGVAWPSLRSTFDLPQAWLAAPLATGAATYFLSGLLAGRLMVRLGIGRLLAASTALAAAGVLGFGLAPAFVAFLLCGAIVGFGSGAVDAALNTYVARHFAARHMTWLHAAYAAGAAVGPALMTALLARELSWRVGYLVIGTLLAFLAFAFFLSRHLWAAGAAQVLVDAPGGHGSAPVEPPTTAWAALRHGNVRLQIATFFLYSGVEVTAGQWSYTILTEARGVDDTTAGGFVTLYWGGLLAGRVLSGFVVERVGNERLLRIATACAVVAAAGFAVPALPPALSAAALALLSFSLAPIYPGLMAETPRRVGGATPHAVGFQVSAATFGIAAVPAMAGAIGTELGLNAIGPLLALCAVLLWLLHERLVARTRA